jgi:cobalt-zinc-cadmium efflux system membrane fusion protein
MGIAASPPSKALTLALALAGLLTLVMPLSTWAAPPKNSGCLIEPEQTADVGSSVTGVVEELPVALGDNVKAGQPVAMLRADVERANAQVAEARSRVDADAKAAQASLVLARQKVKRTQQLLEQNFVSTQAVEQAVAEAEVANQKFQMAKSQQQIYRQEQAVASAQLGLRTLRSPISGVVVERYSNLGERVDDRPVLRIASIDPLRVSLMIPIAQYGQIKEGDIMTIRPELPGTNPINATVRYVDKVVDAASNTFRVRLVLPNPDHRLPGGLRCKADMQAKVSTSTSSPAAAAAALQPALSLAQPVATPRRASTDLATLTLRPTWTLTALVHRHKGRPSLASTTVAAASVPGKPVWLVASLSLSHGR